MSDKDGRSENDIRVSQENMTKAHAMAVKPRRGKLWLDLIMIVSLVLLAVVLWRVTPEQAQLAPLFDDLELLAGSEEPAFYQDLDFYYWLEQQHGRD